jgi:hypothetical protein
VILSTFILKWFAKWSSPVRGLSPLLLHCCWLETVLRSMNSVALLAFVWYLRRTQDTTTICGAISALCRFIKAMQSRASIMTNHVQDVPSSLFTPELIFYRNIFGSWLWRKAEPNARGFSGTGPRCTNLRFSPFCRVLHSNWIQHYVPKRTKAVLSMSVLLLSTRTPIVQPSYVTL